MNGEQQIFGAEALVYLKFDGKLKELAIKIAAGLILQKFYMKSDPDPPHDETALGEGLGFEIWLNHSKEIEGYQYSIKIQTGMSHDEIFNDRMHDLSLWLAGYISTICEIESFVKDVAGEGGAIFEKNNIKDNI